MLKYRIKTYLSHPIRGRAGRAATPEIINFNIKKAVDWAKKLRLYFGYNLDLYVPAEMDLFPRIAVAKGYLDIDQILDVDCEIVSQGDAVIIANWEDHISEGMKREIDKAKELGIPYRVITGVEEADLRALEIWLEQL